MKYLSSGILCLLVMFGFSPNASAQSTPKTVVELAAGNPDLSTFVAAVKAANLQTALSDDGPYTVMAPTNDAFEKLPAGLVDALLLPRNQKVLVDILTFHVIEKKVDAAGVMAGIKADNSGRLIATTMNGNLTITSKGGNVMVKGEQGRTGMVTATDMMAGNGIIHTVNNVFLPEGVDAASLLKSSARAAGQRMMTSKDDMSDDLSDQRRKMETTMTDNKQMNNGQPMTTRSTMRSTSGDGMVKNSIAQVASSNGNFNTLVGALGKVGLADMMSQEGDYTVFAPADAAFDALPNGTVGSLSNTQLSGVLQYHVLPYRMTAAQLMQGIKDAKNYMLLPTVNGKTLVASIRDGKVVLMDDSGKTATVTTTDVQADNGIIHAIDGVLMPR